MFRESENSDNSDGKFSDNSKVVTTLSVFKTCS